MKRRNRMTFITNGVPTYSKKLVNEYIEYNRQVFSNLLEYKKAIFEEAIDIKLSSKSLLNLYRDSQKRRKIDAYYRDDYRTGLEFKLGFRIHQETYESLKDDLIRGYML